MPRDAGAAIRDYATELGVDPDLAFAVGGQESGYNDTAVSPKGAKGAMQVMDATSAEMEPKYGPDRKRQGVGYLKDQLDAFPDIEDEETRKKFALAAYNAGPGRVEKVRSHLRKRGMDDRNFDLVARFLPEETRNYVPGVLGRVTKGKSTELTAGPGIASVQANPYSPEALLAGASDAQKYSPEALLGATAAPAEEPIESPESEEPAPTFMGEMAKEGERQIEGVKNIGRHLAAPLTQESTGSFGGDFKEGIKHGVAAAWEALGLVSPGSIPDAALTAGGHPIAGKVAHAATDIALPFAFGKGRAIKTIGEAGEAVKGAVSTAERAAKGASTAGYAARDAAADAAALSLGRGSKEVAGLKKAAQDTVAKHGSKAKEWLDRIEHLGEDTGHVTHEDVRNIESGLVEGAKRDPWLGHLRDEVKKLRESIEGSTPVAEQSGKLAKEYPAVAKLSKLRRKVVNPGAAPSGEKTATEALRALGDPERLKAAVATMDPKTAHAFKRFHRQMQIASGLTRGAHHGAATTLLAIEGGRLVYHGAQGKLDLGEAAGAAAALALRSPKVAMLVARALTTKKTGAAAALMARRLGDAGVFDGLNQEE